MRELASLLLTADRSTTELRWIFPRPIERRICCASLLNRQVLLSGVYFGAAEKLGRIYGFVDP